MPSERLDAAGAGPEIGTRSRVADESAAEFAHAIAHPLRAHLLDLLATEGPASAAQLAVAIDRPRASIGYHLNVLEACGAVERVPSEVGRRAARTFRATARSIIEDDEWAELPVSHRRGIVAHDLRHIGSEAHAALERGGFDHPQAHTSWAPISLDPVGLEQMAALLRETVGRALAIAADVRQRRPDRRPDEIRTELAILHFSRESAGADAAHPAHELLPHMYSLSEEIGEAVAGKLPNWQTVADRAFELGAVAQRYGATGGDALA